MAMASFAPRPKVATEYLGSVGGRVADDDDLEFCEEFGEDREGWRVR